METPVNPKLVAFLCFDPTAPSPMLGGSWGVQSIGATIGAQAFSVVLSAQFAGGLTVAQAQQLHITPCVHEIFFGYTITPIANGFVIDFGVPLTNLVTIKVEKLVAE